jgi:hypothetical protein
MNGPLVVTVYRKESLRLLVPIRAAGVIATPSHRDQWVGAAMSLLMNAVIVLVLVRGTQLDALPWTSTGRQNADPASAMSVEFLLPQETAVPATPVLTTEGELTVATPAVLCD